MKKYPYVFLGIFISILVFFIVHIISINIKMNRVVYVHTFEGFDQKVLAKNNDMKDIKNEACKASLQDMLYRIVNTIPERGITLKRYYELYYGYANGVEEDDGYTFLHYYSRVSDACNINDESIYLKALESLEFPYEIKNRYIGAYQVNIFDRAILQKEIDKTDELGSYSNKMLEYETLVKLIEEVKNEKNV